MEQNYLENIQTNIKSKRDIQTTLVFNISKTYQNQISKNHNFIKKPQLFVFQNRIKICSVTSVFHPICTKKYTETTLIFYPSKSGQKEYIETTSIFWSLKLHWTKYVKTTLIFCSSRLHWRNYVETASIFCLPKLHWNYVEIYRYFLFNVSM